MILPKIIHILLAATLISCGTITKKNKLLSIDTKPRGIEIKDEKDNLLGVTPLILKQPGKKEKLFLGQNRVPFKQDCRYDWKYSLIPNALMTAIQPVLGASFFVVDWWKDNLKRCQNTYQLSLSLEGVSSLKNSESLYLILPNQVVDQKQMSKLEPLLRDELKGQIIPYGKSLELITKYNLFQEENEYEEMNIPEALLMKMGHEFKMTHLIQIKKYRNNKIFYDVVDVYNTRERVKGKLELASDFIIDDKDNKLKTFAKKSFFLLPNTVALSFIDIASEDLEQTPPIRIDHEQAKGAASLMKNITFERVQHPSLYDDYSLSLQASPSFLTLNSDSRIFLRSNNQEIARTQLNLYALTYNGYLFFHTPLGALSIGLGLGGGHWTEEASEMGMRTKNSMLSKSEIGFTAFVTQRAYVKLVVEFYSFAKPFHVGRFEASEKIQTGTIRFGYYLPEISGYLFQ